MSSSTFITPDRHGYNVKYSPFDSNHLLLASSQLYGLAGGGTLYLLELRSDSEIDEICKFEWSDGLFDVAWCPYADNVAATASGDGSLQIWDLEAREKSTKPMAVMQEHKNEVYSIDWGEQWNNHHILSASWDGSMKLWDSNRLNSVATFVGHSDLIYCAKFSPLLANIFSSVSTDGHLNLWNSLDFSGKPLISVPAHAGEVLTCDWSKFDRNVLVTGGSDGVVRGWDLRNLRQHTFELYSGEYAVRRLAFSPCSPTLLAAANYDFTTRIWDLSMKYDAIETIAKHSEFVYGIDWNVNNPNQIADCGWDSVLNVYTPESLKDKLN
ncbi:peroxisomal targeting signal 2 receptor [Episyrphus balteatus]|uniref:peroxisomal targeting signal 2 receptor n=1 Tax=Episyrphus balteatus TaxID=286459 RepID=UPI002485811B|nr:peroxisomal targeting signal 2 receptor [Episyrphus balteatus]